MCRPISFRNTDGLVLQPGSTLAIDCAFNTLDLYGRNSSFELPPRGTLELHRCYVDNYRDAKEAAAPQLQPQGGGCPGNDRATFGGAGPNGGVVRALNSTVHFFEAVRCLHTLCHVPRA
jgi:hypothetical protein